MGVACGVEDAGARIGHVCHYGDELEAVHELYSILAGAFKSEGYDAARAVGEVFLLEVVVFIAFEVGVVDPCHFGACFEPLGYGEGVLAVALHAEVECLEAEVEEERVLRSRDGAEVTHELRDELRGVGFFAEGFGVGEAVVALVGGGQAWEFIVVCFPVEVAAVAHGTAYLRGMAVHVFGGGVCDDVGAPLEWAAVDGGGEGVVDDEGHAMFVGHLGEAFDVEHSAAGVGYGFAEEEFGVGAESGLDLLVGPLGVDEGALYAEFLHGDAKEVVGAAVDVVGSDEVVACLADVEHGVEVGGLAGGGEYASYTALELVNLVGYGVVGGVLEAGVEVARGFEVEEVGHVLGGVVFEGSALDDGEDAALAILGLPSALHADGSGFTFCHCVCIVEGFGWGYEAKVVKKRGMVGSGVAMWEVWLF